MALFSFGKPPGTSQPPMTASQPIAPPAPASVAANIGSALTPMEDLLRLCVDEGGSDIHLSVGAPPAIRLRGKLVKLELRPLTAGDTETLARAIASEANLHRANSEGSVDFGLTFRGDNRFRVSLYRQKGTLAMVLRLI